jgi:hypothetical protein
MQTPIQWIATLRTKPKATPFIQDFLNIIQHHMLIVDKNTRGTATSIEPLFNEMQRKCNEDPSYYSMPAPLSPTGDLAAHT